MFASAIHGRLLNAMLELIPAKSQLWIATHSTGFVRKALELNRQEDNVAILDFSGHDFDSPVTLTPTIPNQTFFRKMYDVLQEDLAGLIAPTHIVLCEGNEKTDSKIYNKVFGESHPDTLFVSRGGSNNVEQGGIISVLDAIVPSVRVWRLIDRDEMSCHTRDEKISEGIHVLRRRDRKLSLGRAVTIHRFGTGQLDSDNGAGGGLWLSLGARWRFRQHAGEDNRGPGR